MKFTEREFIPVLFGNDIHVYSMARAFYEEYKVQSKVFGTAALGACYKSKMIDFTEVKNLDTPEILQQTLNDYAQAHRDSKIIALACSDAYVKCLTQNREEFRKNIIIPYAEYDFLTELMDKQRFYKLCENMGIDFPRTYICTPRDVGKLHIPFDPPYILKPANPVEYYRHKFVGQKKVFKLDTQAELEMAVMKIYAAGYTENMIVQEFIPGDDTHMRVLTSYSDRYSKVKMMCLGHVLLEEHTPHDIGNHTVIITEYEDELMGKFRNLLESIGYIGFSNFDVKYDTRDNKYKVFEINTRPGRSNFYVTGSGHNIARLVVEDYLYNRHLEEDFVRNEHLWMVVPKCVALRYAPEYRIRMKRLIRTGKYINPLYYKADNDIERWLRLFASQIGYIVKYRKYFGK